MKFLSYFMLLFLSLNYLAFADSQIITTKSDFEKGNISDTCFTLNDDGEAVQDPGMVPDAASRATLTLPKPLFDHAMVLIGNSVIIAGGVDESSYSSDVYINTIDNNTLGAWQTGPSLAAGIRGHQLVRSGPYVYCLGGRTTGGLTKIIYMAKFDFDQHTLSAWNPVGNMPEALENYGAVTYGGQLYIIGGSSTGDSSAVYYADINPDGSLNTWQSTSSLPVALHDMATVVYGSRIFVLGGVTGSSGSAAMYSAVINNDGTLASWETEKPFPATISRNVLVTTSSGMISVGGYDSSISHYKNTVDYTFLQDAHGGPDSWSGEILYNLADCTACVYNQHLFIFGGRDGSGLKDNVEIIPLMPFSPWKPSTKMTDTLKGAEYLIGIYDYIYFFGGINPNFTANVYRSRFNAQGNGVGTWTLDTTMPATLYSPGVSAYNDRIYLLGGQLPDSSTDTSTVYFSNQINPNDGHISSWTETTPLPHAMPIPRCVAYNGKIYVFEGASVYFNSILSDGTIGPVWQQTAGLPMQIHPYTKPVIFNDKIYVVAYDTSKHLYYANIKSNGLFDSWRETKSPPSNLNVFHLCIKNNVLYGVPAFSWCSLNQDGSVNDWHKGDYNVVTWWAGIDVINDYINIFDSLNTIDGAAYTKLTCYRSTYFYPFYFNGAYKNLVSLAWGSSYATNEYGLKYRIYDQGWGAWTAVDNTQTTASINQKGTSIQVMVHVNTYRQNNGSLAGLTLNYDNNIVTPSPTPQATATPQPTSTPVNVPEGFNGKLISKKTTYAFPNPAQGTAITKFNIFTKESSHLILKIYTSSHRFVYSKELDSSEVGWNLMEWEHGHMANGVYIYMIQATGLQTGYKEKVINYLAIIK